MLDVEARLDGEANGHFTVYSTAANLDLMRRSYRKTPFLAQVPEERMAAIARHPESARCTSTGPPSR